MACQGHRFSCETPIRVFSPGFTLHAIWRTNVRSGFKPQSTALEGRRTGKICNCGVQTTPPSKHVGFGKQQANGVGVGVSDEPP